MPGQFTPPVLTGTIKKQTVNFGFVIPRFDSPGWGLALEDNWDTIDATLFAITGISGIRGAWDHGVEYIAGDRAVDVNINAIFQTTVTHTSASTGTFADDRAAHPTYWIPVTAASLPRGQWTTATNYNTGEIVTDQGRTGVVNKRYTSGATYNADVTAGSITTIVDVSTFQDFGTAINASPNKAVLADTDKIGVVDPATKHQTWAQLKTGIKAYLDPLLAAAYQPLRTVLTNTTASFTTALETKLNGIATGAQVVDATTVGATFGAATPSGSISDTDEVAGNSGNVLKTWTWLTLKTTLQTFLVDLLVKPGTIVATGRSTPDAGYLECNGAAVSRTGATAALFAAIGTAYGAGNGSTTFNVPDYRGIFIRGWDHGRGYDSGRVLGSNQAANFGQHYHDAGGLVMPNHGHPMQLSVRNDSQVSSTTTGGMVITNIVHASYGAYAGGVDGAAGHQIGGSGTMAIGGTTAWAGSGDTFPYNQSAMYQIKL